MLYENDKKKKQIKPKIVNKTTKKVEKDKENNDDILTFEDIFILDDDWIK